MSRRPRSSKPTAPATNPRGITSTDVDRAADALLREGLRPTIEKVRAKIGRGSPNTVNPLLDKWWSRLAGRLDAGPAALHRLPEPVLHAAEALWLQCLDDARRRSQLESGSTRKTLNRERQDLAVQAHVLAIRENELKARIDAAERRTARLELEVESLTTLLRKEQASRLAAERRGAQQQEAVGSRRTPRKSAAQPVKRPTKPLPRARPKAPRRRR
jgi:hypothetical protein